MGINTKLNGGVIVFALLIIPFLSISGVREGMAETTYQNWQVLSVMAFLLFIWTKPSSMKFNWGVGLFTVYHIIIMGSTFLNNGFSSGILMITMAYIFVFILLQSEYYQQILASICWIVVFAALINLWSMVKSTGSHYSLYFIGGKNALSMFLIPGAFLVMINSLEKYDRVIETSMAVVAVCLLSTYMGASGTGMVIAAIATVFMILAVKTKPKKNVYIIIILIFYVLFIVFSESFFATDHWFEFTDSLGKDSTLTSRTTIWRIAKEIISENWLFGAGRGTRISYMNSWGELHFVTEAHNFVLEILMEGGVVALAVYLTLLYKIISRLDVGNIRHRIIFMALCVLLINGLTESTLNNFFVTIVLGIACRYATEERGEVDEQQIQKFKA